MPDRVTDSVRRGRSGTRRRSADTLPRRSPAVPAPGLHTRRAPASRPGPRGRPFASSAGRQLTGVAPRVAHGQDLPQMPIGVFTVQVLAAQTRVAGEIIVAMRAAPVGDAGGLDPPENRVEAGIVHAEADMVALEPLPVGEIERQPLVGVDGHELSEGLAPGHVEQGGKRLGAGVLVTRRNDDVVELDRHRTPPLRAQMVPRVTVSRMTDGSRA